MNEKERIEIEKQVKKDEEVHDRDFSNLSRMRNVRNVEGI
jgi:hypothetical protein